MSETKKKATYQTAAKRTREGEKHEMETLPGFYFYPVKFSIEGTDELNSIILDKKNSLSRSSIKVIKEIAGKKNIQTKEDVMKELTEDQVLDVLNTADKSLLADGPTFKAKLKYGFGRNNFGDVETAGASGPEGKITNDKFLDELIVYDEVVREIVGAIDIWNSPLPARQSSS